MSKEESLPVTSSASEFAVEFWKAKVIKEINAMTTPVQNADFEQGFQAAKKRAIKIFLDNK